jgi:hypothetical protein
MRGKGTQVVPQAPKGDIWELSQKYELPGFLHGSGLTAEQYRRWLSRKAATHCKRDRRRSNDTTITISHYKQLIHSAVCDSGGYDWYTGENLRWDLLSQFDNDSAKAGRTEYKSRFSMLPTIDHIPGRESAYDFVICAWRTNDAKSDLRFDEFVDLCRKVLARHG